VALGSRNQSRAAALAGQIQKLTGGRIIPFEMARPDQLAREIQTTTIVISAGPPGIQLVPAAMWQNQPALKALIDLNAVPPLGIEGVEASDKGKERHGVRTWGALGVGGTKMKIHKRAINQLFTANNLVLDAEEVLELGRSPGA
jgi:hypothetical protein